MNDFATPMFELVLYTVCDGGGGGGGKDVQEL
jgi:hypothetical protein